MPKHGHAKTEKPRKRQCTASVAGLWSLPRDVWWLVRDFTPASAVWLGATCRKLCALVREPSWWQGYVQPPQLLPHRADHANVLLALYHAGRTQLGHVEVVPAERPHAEQYRVLRRCAALLRGCRVRKLVVRIPERLDLYLAQIVSGPAEIQELDVQGRARVSDLVVKAPAALRALSLSFCEDAEDLAHLTAFRSLARLRIRACSLLQGTGLLCLSQLGSLRRLELGSLSRGGLECLRELRQLDQLAVFWTPSASDPRPVLQLRQLRRLSLAGCSNVTDALLQGLPALDQLRDLDLSDCDGVQGSGVRALLRLRQLRSLKLKLTGGVGGLEALPFLPLHKLQLGRCPELTGADLGLLGLCHSLRDLSLQECSGVTSVTELRHLPSLCRLTLRACASLHDLGPLRHCAGLQWLGLELWAGALRLDQLPALSGLRELFVYRCQRLENLAALRHCSALHTVTFQYCPKLTTPDLATLLAPPRWSLRKLCLSTGPRIEREVLQQLVAGQQNTVAVVYDHAGQLG